jgi:hypothetical protein
MRALCNNRDFQSHAAKRLLRIIPEAFAVQQESRRDYLLVNTPDSACLPS